jgi:hypothetical protein
VLVASGRTPERGWRRIVREALFFLGGQPDRHRSSLAAYDHRRNGPFLGVSDEGSAAAHVRKAALNSPKALALGSAADPLSVGVGQDGERLGGVGEVPVGPGEFADIWTECIGRILMTTNVGSRANLRLYRRAPLVMIRDGPLAEARAAAKVALATAFKPFLQAAGGPRPLVVDVEFEFGSKRPVNIQQKVLRSLRKYVKTAGVADPKTQDIALTIRLGWDDKGRKAALNAIDLASAAGIEHVTIDGVVRKDADALVSLSGLLNYLPPDGVTAVLEHAQAKGVRVRGINQPDPDTVAREIWSALNTARAMGLDLGKYGLFPLTLEECDRVVQLIQQWFGDWSAAPVFYVDQGILTKRRVYVAQNIEKGIEAWLRVIAKHKVRVCLIDTVDKAKGWKILKSEDEPNGILRSEQIARLNALGEKLGIGVLWAGGITLPQAYEFGKLGVFGIYVTTAASAEIAVGRAYQRDPALAAEKEPTYPGVLMVKTALEGGFLAARLGTGSARVRNKQQTLRTAIEQAGTDRQKLAAVLPMAWRSWWRDYPR